MKISKTTFFLTLFSLGAIFFNSSWAQSSAKPQITALEKQYNERIILKTADTLENAQKAFNEQLPDNLKDKVVPNCAAGEAGAQATCSPPPWKKLPQTTKNSLSALFKKEAQEKKDKDFIDTLKKCGDTLQNSSKLKEALRGGDLDNALSKVMQNRVDLAFGRTAMAYLKLMEMAGNELEIGPEGNPVAAQINSKLPQDEKQLADKLFQIIEPTGSTSDQDTDEFLKGLKAFSVKRYSAPNMASYKYLALEDSDLAIMKRLLPEIQTGNSPLSGEMKNIATELKELIGSKGGRKNQPLIKKMINDVKVYSNAKKNVVANARAQLVKALKNFELSPNASAEEKACLKTLRPFMYGHSAETAFDKAMKNPELQSCSYLSFINSVFPSGVVTGFQNMNDQALGFLQSVTAPKIDPNLNFQRGKLSCERYVNEDGSFKVRIFVNAPRKTFENWQVDRNGETVLTPPADISKCNPKWKSYKTCVATAEKANGVGNIEIPHNKLYKKDEAPSEKLKVYSPRDNATGKREYEFIDVAKACDIKTAPVIPAKVAIASCTYDQNSKKFPEILLDGVSPDSKVKINGVEVTVAAKGDKVGVFDFENKDATKIELEVGNKKSSLAVSDCKVPPPSPPEVGKCLLKKDPVTGTLSVAELTISKLEGKTATLTFGDQKVQKEIVNGQLRFENLALGANLPEKFSLEGPTNSKDSLSFDAKTLCQLPEQKAHEEVTNEAGIKECSLELNDKGDIVIKELLFDTENKSLDGAKIQIGDKTRTIATKSASGTDPAVRNLGGDFTIGKSFPKDGKMTVQFSDGKRVSIDISSVCPEKEQKEKEAEEKEIEAKKEQKRKMMADACGGGEGKESSWHGNSFILCQNGVSDSERMIINNFCHGQAGEYDPASGFIYCAPFNNAGPAPLSPPNLPPSIFNGVYGVNSKGFY